MMGRMMSRHARRDGTPAWLIVAAVIGLSVVAIAGIGYGLSWWS